MQGLRSIAVSSESHEVAGGDHFSPVEKMGTEEDPVCQVRRGVWLGHKYLYRGKFWHGVSGLESCGIHVCSKKVPSTYLYNVI